MNISHTKDCWLNFYPSPPWLVLPSFHTVAFKESWRSSGHKPSLAQWDASAGLSDVWKESLTKCWIRCLSDSGVNSLLMGTMLSFRTRIALPGGRGKAQLCQTIAVHPKLLKMPLYFK